MPGKRKKNQQQNKKLHGQSLIEFALILPILLVLIVGALEFGRLFFTKIVVTNAAREGAYYLSIYPGDTANATLAAEAEAANSGISTITVTPNTITYAGYTSIEVTVETVVQDLLILGIVGNLLSSNNFADFPISSTVEMMVQ